MGGADVVMRTFRHLQARDVAWTAFWSLAIVGMGDCAAVDGVGEEIGQVFSVNGDTFKLHHRIGAPARARRSKRRTK